MSEERQAPRVGVALFDGSRLDSVVNTDSRWPTSLWLSEQLYMGGASQDAWSRHAPCLRRTRYVSNRSPRGRVDQLLRRRVNTAKSEHHGVRGDDVVSHYGAKSEAAIDFRRGVVPINNYNSNGGVTTEAMDTYPPDDQTEVRKTVTFNSDVDDRAKSTVERRDKGRCGGGVGGESVEGSRVGSDIVGGAVPHLSPYLHTSNGALPSEDGFGAPSYHIGSSRDGGAPPRPTVDPSVSNTARQLLHRKLRTQVLSFPRISVELQRKALGSAPRYENVRNAVNSARAYSRTPANIGANPSWLTMSTERSGLPTLQALADDRKPTTPTVAANQYGPKTSLEGSKSRDKYSRMTALGLPRVNIDRPLSYSRQRRAMNHHDTGDTETIVSDAISLLAAERARAAEVIRIPVEVEADDEEPEEDAWPGDVVAQTNGVDLDAVAAAAAAATENGIDHVPRHAEKTTRLSGNTHPHRRKDVNPDKGRHYDASVGVIGVSCRIETPRKDTAVPVAATSVDTTGR